VTKYGCDLITAKQKKMLTLIFGFMSLVDTRLWPKIDGSWNKFGKLL